MRRHALTGLQRAKMERKRKWHQEQAAVRIQAVLRGKQGRNLRVDVMEQQASAENRAAIAAELAQAASKRDKRRIEQLLPRAREARVDPAAVKEAEQVCAQLLAACLQGLLDACLNWHYVVPNV